MDFHHLVVSFIELRPFVCRPGVFASSRRELETERQTEGRAFCAVSVAGHSSDAEQDQKKESAENREQQRETFFRLLHGAAPSLR